MLPTWQTVTLAGLLGTNIKLYHGDSWIITKKKIFARKVLSFVLNYYYLLVLIIHSLRTSMCLQIFIHLSATFQDRWPWVFHPPRQIHGHFPHPWNFIYYPQKLLYLSGWSWFQFSIPAKRQSERRVHDHVSLFTVRIEIKLQVVVVVVVVMDTEKLQVWKCLQPQGHPYCGPYTCHSTWSIDHELDCISLNLIQSYLDLLPLSSSSIYLFKLYKLTLQYRSQVKLKCDR